MEKRIAILIIVSFLIGLTACGKEADISIAETVISDSVENEGVSEEKEPIEAVAEEIETEKEINEQEGSVDIPEGLNEIKYKMALKNSLISTGNNYRLKKVIEKARNGETVNYAALGGSITEGALAATMHQGYAYQFADLFKEKYCSGDNLNYVNAGLSGTPSPLGAMRYEKDIIDELGTVPDLLIIEFAVNDYQEPTKGKALEGLIYRALTDNENCAVILLFSCSQSKTSSQNDMSGSGYYYKLPMVSVKDFLMYAGVSDEEFFGDEYHPTTYGHRLMANCLMNLFETCDADTENEIFDIPDEAKKDRGFSNMTLVTSDSKEVLSKGSFGNTDTKVQQSAFKNKLSFPKNFMYSVDGENESLIFSVNASKVLISYKLANDSSYGEAVVLLDGKEVGRYNGYDKSGWNNCAVDMILDEDEKMNHTIEIKMSEDSVNKKFTFLGLSYN